MQSGRSSASQRLSNVRNLMHKLRRRVDALLNSWEVQRQQTPVERAGCTGKASILSLMGEKRKLLTVGSRCRFALARVDKVGAAIKRHDAASVSRA